MISKSERLLIFRFLLSKKSDGYVSIFAWFSIIGISLGVAAIIIVMSVMNGFRVDLTNRIIGLNSHLNIYSFDNEITNKQADELILNIDNSFFYQHYKSIETNGLIIKSNNSKGVMIKGYDAYDKNHYLFNSINRGALIQNPKSEILIGDSLANEMDLSVGDKVKIAIPKTDKTILGNIPRFKTLEVVGVFDLGLYEYDSNLIFLSSELVRKLLLYDEDIYNKIEFFTSSPNEIELFKNKVELETSNLLLNFYSISWKDQNKTLINALKVEKNVMFIILSLIILVASLNIISGLIIFVKEKNKHDDLIIFNFDNSYFYKHYKSI
jgi:lipoprotein-releasing system permease protein